MLELVEMVILAKTMSLSTVMSLVTTNANGDNGCVDVDDGDGCACHDGVSSHVGGTVTVVVIMLRVTFVIVMTTDNHLQCCII